MTSTPAQAGRFLFRLQLALFLPCRGIHRRAGRAPRPHRQLDPDDARRDLQVDRLGAAHRAASLAGQLFGDGLQAQRRDGQRAVPLSVALSAGEPQRARVLLWLQQTAPEKARPFALAVFRNLFVHDGDIQDRRQARRHRPDARHRRSGLRASIQDPAIKQRLAQNNESAISRQVFGAPTFFVGDEQFWGHDRMPQLERRLQQLNAA